MAGRSHDLIPLTICVRKVLVSIMPVAWSYHFALLRLILGNAIQVGRQQHSQTKKPKLSRTWEQSASPEGLRAIPKV